MGYLYYRLAVLLGRWDKSHRTISVDKEKIFIDSLNKYPDDIERSYCQYLCQNFYKPKWLICILNFVSFFALPFVVSWLLIKGVMIRRAKESLDAVSNMGHIKEVIPDSLFSEYDINFDNWYKGRGIPFKDIPFIIKLIVRHLFNTYFVLKNIIKVASYYYMIHRFSVRAIITFNEFAFTSSISTLYCSRYGVRHINVMHGEKLFYIRDSFFRFDKCYVWSEYYKELFLSLRAEKSQFIIEQPPMFKIDIERYYKKEAYADYKYYLAVYTKEQILSIVKSMNDLIDKGYTIKLRPHPSYSDIEMLENVVDKSLIEYSSEVPILVSVANMRGAIGSYSTVLNQAYNIGKEVILDNITYNDEFQLLKQRQYILSEQLNNCHVFSELIQ